MRYVGIDPSTKTGLVIIDKNNEIINVQEVFSTSKEDPERFVDIASQILEELHPNDIITIEGFSYGSKGKGVSTQYGVGWVIRTFLYERGYDYIEIPPTSVKKFATGKGNSAKNLVMKEVYKKWGFENDSDNIVDAYVLAQIVKALHGEEGLTAYQKEVMKKIQEGK
jgi:crossover junction endodeoxyribonuclease RuvC